MKLRIGIYIMFVFIVLSICISANSNVAATNAENNSSATGKVNPLSDASDAKNSGANLSDTFPDKKILVWVDGSQINWFAGTLLALSGLIGALVTIYGLVGTVMPGTSGQIRLDIDEIRLEKLKEKQDSLWAKEGTDDFNVESAKAMDFTVKSLQTYLSKERWRQFGLAAFLYAILGAFFAALLSGGVLEALLIGAGWTAYLGAIGLKKSNEERGAYKDRLIEDLTHQGNKQEVVISMLEDRLKEVASVSDKPHPPEPPKENPKKK